MNKRDARRFQRLLFVERERLLGSITTIERASRNAEGRERSIDVEDCAESGSDAFDLQNSLNIASAESERLADIEEALLRIQEGTYGICQGSGQPIPRQRLEVFPAARYTVEYQEQLEKRQALRL